MVQHTEKEKHMKIEKEVRRPVHPQHRQLKLEYTEVPFYCDGCKEAGIGFKYKCQQCDLELHKACAVAPFNFRIHVITVEAKGEVGPIDRNARLIIFTSPVLKSF